MGGVKDMDIPFLSFPFLSIERLVWTSLCMRIKAYYHFHILEQGHDCNSLRELILVHGTFLACVYSHLCKNLMTMMDVLTSLRAVSTLEILQEQVQL